MEMNLVFSIMCSIIGYSILITQLFDQFEKFGLNRNTFHKFKIALSIFLLFNLFFADNFPILIWTQILIVIFLIFSIPTLISAYISIKIDEHIPKYLNQIIFEVSSGKSLKVATGMDFTGIEVWLSKQLKLINKVLEFQMNESQIFHPGLRNLANELKIIDKSQNRTLEQLMTYRDFLHTRINLRHRSRSASLNMTIQGVILVGIYIILLISSILHYPWNEVSTFVCYSIIWFIFGTVTYLIIKEFGDDAALFKS